MTICVLFASCDYSDNDKHLDFADEYREYGNMLVLGVVSYALVAIAMLFKIRKTSLGEALKNQSL